MKDRHKIIRSYQNHYPIIKNLKDAFYVLDKQMRLLYVNAIALRLWRKKRNEIVGRIVWEVFPQAVGTQVYKKHYEAQKKKKSLRFEAVSPVLGKWMEVNIIPISETSEIVVYFHDISKRKEMEAKLRQQAKLLQLSQDAFIVQDKDSKITFWSKGAEKIYGYSEKEALGKMASEFLKTRFPVPLGEIHREVRNNKVWKGELTHMTASGRELTVESRWTLIEDDSDKEAYSYLEVNTDITKRKELEQQRENFISFATHELNAPLAAMKVFIHLLERKITQFNDNDLLKLLQKISAQVFKMTDLVSYLLDDTRVQTGKLSIYKDEFRLDELMKEAVDTIGRTNGTHKITLDTPKPIYVLADRQRIQQVVVNIISNGIKYSPDEDVIHVEVKERQKDYLVMIRDSGLGIAKKDLSKVFDRFYQSEDMNAKKAQGLGLGLYISKEIIKKHNGDIWVESEKGKGSIFCFTLPKE